MLSLKSFIARYLHWDGWVGFWRYAPSQSKMPKSTSLSSVLKNLETVLKSSHVVWKSSLLTKELTEGMSMSDFGKDKSLIGLNYPSPFITAPRGLVWKKPMFLYTSSCEKGPFIRPFATSFLIFSSILSLASMAERRFGGEYHGNLPIVWLGIPWWKPSVKPSIKYRYLFNNPKVFNSSSQASTFISHVTVAGHCDVMKGSNLFNKLRHDSQTFMIQYKFYDLQTFNTSKKKTMWQAAYALSLEVDCIGSLVLFAW